MRLLLMRHGIAAEREEWPGTDATRPLTPEGKSKAREVARGLRQIEARIDCIATSPLLRARQTADIVGDMYDSEVKEWPELEHGSWDELAPRLAALKQHLTPDSVVLLTGHEPSLSVFAMRLFAGSVEGDTLEMKKAGICALDVEEFREAGASLVWHMPPRTLRMLA
jgi:phosphohistidine phosphatase